MRVTKSSESTIRQPGNKALRYSRREFVGRGLRTAGGVVGSSLLLSRRSLAAQGEQGVTYMVAGGSPFSAAVIQRIPEFESSTGIKVQVVELPYEQTLPKAILEAKARSGVYDLIQINRPNLAALVEPNLLVPLQGLVSQALVSDLFLVHRTYGTFGGKLYAIPHSNDVRALYYRTDLFKTANLQQPPQNWNDQRDDAKKLNNPAQGVSGLLISGRDGPGAWTFSDFLTQAGAQILDSQGRPGFNNPAGVKALSYLVDLFSQLKVLPQGTPNYMWVDTRTLFAQGRSAMVIEFNDIIPLLEDPKTSVVGGKYDLALIPGDVRRATNNAGWLLGIPTGAKRAQNAGKLLEWILSPAIQQHMCLVSGTLSPRQSVIDALIAKGNPTLGKGDPKSKARWVFYKQVIAMTYELPRTSKEPQIEDALTEAYTAALTGQKNPKQALDDAAASVRKVMGQ